VESDACLERPWPMLVAGGRNLLVALAVAAFLNLPAFAQGVVKVGQIASVEGDASLVRNGHRYKAAPSMALETNDKLATGRNGHLTVTFGDNSSLTLDESASVVINQDVAGGKLSAIERVGLLNGRLHSIFNAAIRTGASFEVRTPNALVGVRGTEFETAYIAGTPCPGFPKCLRYTDVGVYKGRVEVSNPLNPKAAPVIAAAGYETTVPCEEPPATPSPLGMEHMLSPSYR
jgi:ferric-dicitrate binding protein FerR (iron transport regulator)